jgi:hypothetical protein
MFRRILDALGGPKAQPSPEQVQGAHRPYQQPEVNFIYNLLFCDELALFKPKDADVLSAPYLQVLFAETPDPIAISALANDPEQESRVRALAYNWLREHQHPVPARVVLGVIVEMPLSGGLDVLAAYADGRVRYINQSGKMVIVEGAAPAIEQQARELVRSAEAVVTQIGPWHEARLAPPAADLVRLTFLASDGLYFGEGQYADIRVEPMAAPVIEHAEQLLMLVTEAATAPEA